MPESEEDLLEIPSFLRRSKTKPKVIKKGRSNKPAPPSALPPEGYKQYHIFNNNEIYALGSGYRIVWAKIGRKWAFIWRGEGHNRIRVRCNVFKITILDKPVFVENVT